MPPMNCFLESTTLKRCYLETKCVKLGVIRPPLPSLHQHSNEIPDHCLIIAGAFDISRVLNLWPKLRIFLTKYILITSLGRVERILIVFERSHCGQVCGGSFPTSWLLINRPLSFSWLLIVTLAPAAPLIILVLTGLGSRRPVLCWYTVQCAVCSVQCAVCSVQCQVRSVQCTVRCVSAVWSGRCSSGSVQYWTTG